VIGIIKETMGFRQFSLRGLANANGEWILVCLAYNIKRLHTLLGGLVPAGVHAAQVAAARAVFVFAWLVARACGHPSQAVRSPVLAAASFGSRVLSTSLPCLTELSPTSC
jgi:Transposase DDE domain